MKISIITINKNNLRGLQKTMDSILLQTSNDYEWIVIDGDSTDGCIDFIKHNTSNISYWVSEPDKGIYEAMNKGVNASSGDYLLFLHSGDSLAAQDILKSFFDLQPEADVIHGNTIIVDSNNKEVGKYIAPENVRLSYFRNHTLNHQGTFFHKRCFEHFRYNEDNRIASDLELYMQLLYHGYTFQKWDKFVERFEAGGLSFQYLKVAQAEFGSIVNRVLPPGVKADYDEIIQFRDVDLYRTIRRVIESPRWVRNLARLALLPFRLFLE